MNKCTNIDMTQILRENTNRKCDWKTTNVSIQHDMIDACVRPDKDYLKLINFCVKG